MNRYKKYCLLSVLGVILLSLYPIYMGISVIIKYLQTSMLFTQDYPKYIIPYTPICISLLFAVCLMPLAIKFCRRYAIPVLSVLSVAVFFISEFLFENMIVVHDRIPTTIQDWQMLSCFSTPEYLYKIDILAGDYTPLTKMHFYLISILIILSVVNCFLGFAVMLKENKYERKKPLILQAVSVCIFIGMCIFACFTAFFRTGEIELAPISAILTGTFFVCLGFCAGCYAGSFLFQKRNFLSVCIPSLISILFTVLMYLGELILLDGSVYKFGSGFFFDPLIPLPLAFVDFCIILLSGGSTYFTLKKLNR